MTEDDDEEEGVGGGVVEMVERERDGGELVEYGGEESLEGEEEDDFVGDTDHLAEDVDDNDDQTESGVKPCNPS